MIKSNAGWRKKLYVIIFEADTYGGKFFDVGLLWAILLSVFCIVLESDAEIRRDYGVFLRYVEWSFTIIFTIEYVVRIVCSKNPFTYIKSFFGIVDLISIVPAYLSLLIPGAQFLLVTRTIRLLRVFRVLKLARYLQESRVLLQALGASRYKVTVFLGVVLTVILILGTIMHLVEAGNPGFSTIFHGMYWSIVTMTTVGYGDVVPLTGVGKLLASIIMVMGYGIIAVPTGIISVEINQAMRQPMIKCNICGTGKAHQQAKFCHECGELF